MPSIDSEIRIRQWNKTWEITWAHRDTIVSWRVSCWWRVLFWSVTLYAIKSDISWWRSEKSYWAMPPDVTVDFINVSKSELRGDVAWIGIWIGPEKRNCGVWKYSPCLSDIKSYLLDHVANSSVVNVQVRVQESKATGAVSYEVDFKFKPLEFFAKSEHKKQFSESLCPLGHSPRTLVLKRKKVEKNCPKKWLMVLKYWSPYEKNETKN